VTKDAIAFLKAGNAWSDSSDLAGNVMAKDDRVVHGMKRRFPDYAIDIINGHSTVPDEDLVGSQSVGGSILYLKRVSLSGIDLGRRVR
jgi:hypothetical protein